MDSTLANYVDNYQTKFDPSVTLVYLYLNRLMDKHPNVEHVPILISSLCEGSGVCINSCSKALKILHDNKLIAISKTNCGGRTGYAWTVTMVHTVRVSIDLRRAVAPPSIGGAKAQLPHSLEEQMVAPPSVGGAVPHTPQGITSKTPPLSPQNPIGAAPSSLVSKSNSSTSKKSREDDITTEPRDEEESAIHEILWKTLKQSLLPTKPVVREKMVALYRKYGAAWFEGYATYFGKVIIRRTGSWGYQPGNFVSPTFYGEYITHRGLVEHKDDSNLSTLNPPTIERLAKMLDYAKQQENTRRILLKRYPKSMKNLMDMWEREDTPNDPYLLKLRLALRKETGYIPQVKGDSHG
jgi:hypothetical protein